MFSNILLCVDGSDESKKAAVLAADVACAGHAEVVVLHVREYGATAALSYPYEVPGEAPDLVDEAVRGLKDNGISARGEIRDCLHGSVADQIARLADEVDADLIVMGSRGLSDWAGVVTGSVTHAVLHQTHRPVLVAR
jgi:nucleotide-binding universal stress UspA family protein